MELAEYGGFENMTEKTFTQEEINEITNKLFLHYWNLFVSDKMDFKDITLIENVINRIQSALNDTDAES